MSIRSSVFLKWFLFLIFTFSLLLSSKRVVIQRGYEEHHFLTHYRQLSSFYTNTDIVQKIVKKAPTNQVLHDGFVWIVESQDET
jgi:membrane protein implicated in regulation of membrane protease activity